MVADDSRPAINFREPRLLGNEEAFEMFNAIYGRLWKYDAEGIPVQWLEEIQGERGLLVESRAELMGALMQLLAAAKAMQGHAFGFEHEFVNKALVAAERALSPDGCARLSEAPAGHPVDCNCGAYLECQGG